MWIDQRKDTVLAGRKSTRKRERDLRRAMGKRNNTKKADRAEKGRSDSFRKSHRGKGAREMELRDVECIFSYSGRGFGFAEPVEVSSDGAKAEDIFIPPHSTMGAMTGDRVLVTVKQRGGGRNGDRTEGEVTSILEPGCTALVGTLHVRDGYAWVIPDVSRMNVAVFVPMKDCNTLDVGENTKVEVIPDGAPAFNRAMSIHVDPRRGAMDDLPYFDTKGRISEVFGDAGTREANYAAILHESGIRTVFPEKVLKEAEISSKEELTAEGRQDLRDRRIFTIDGAGAKDLDDAISMEETAEGYVLGVHIADVSHYVPYGSVVEKEAAARGTSVYFTDKVVPMLPQCLSNGSCSLNAGEDKYALTAEITLDKNGVRTGTRIFKSIIRSTVRGVYSEVNDLFDKGKDSEFYDKYSAVYEDLAVMHRLYLILREKGFDRGVLELEDSEAVILLDETGFPTDIVKRERGDGEKLIEQFMLQANMGVAETLSHCKLPCLYRIHEEPNREKIRDFAVFAHNIGLNTHNVGGILGSADSQKGKEDCSEDKKAQNGLSAKARLLSEKLMLVLGEAEEKGIADIVSSVLLRCMMKAKYSPECTGHFGLGADMYSHFTSPIRRYPDYFVHSVITAVLGMGERGELAYRNGETPVSAEPAGAAVFRKAAADRAEMANDCEMRAVTAERAIEDLYKALYLSDKIGERFEAVVCSVIRFGMFVRLPNLVEGLVPCALLDNAMVNEELHTLRAGGRTYTLGSTVAVELIESDVATGKITFKLCEEQ